MANRSDYVHKRKGRYMAQFLEFFEEQIEPLVPKDIAESVKAQARRKFNALAVDACELIELEGDAMNGYARDMKDRVHPDAAPSPTPIPEEVRP